MLAKGRSIIGTLLNTIARGNAEGECRTWQLRMHARRTGELYPIHAGEESAQRDPAGKTRAVSRSEPSPLQTARGIGGSPPVTTDLPWPTLVPRVSGERLDNPLARP